MSQFCRLSLWRHAKSDWSQPHTSDHDRPLNPRGRRAVPLMTSFFDQQQLQFDLILASTARRVQETLELFLENWHQPFPSIITTEKLYLAPPRTMLELLMELGDQYRSVMIIAHNPGIAELASQLSGQELEFPTACFASFQFHITDWSNIEPRPGPSCLLDCYCRPKELA